jgi:glycosyltransferase involved in cell wall biosynthesis
MATVSIIICTHNRADYLKQNLCKIVEVKYDYKDVELLVIDNNSTDKTKIICSEFINLHPEIKIRYIFESKLGLSNARNRGIDEALGEYIIFLDDDAYPEPGWLEEIMATFRETNADAVGGKVDLIYEEPKPEWLTPELELALTKIDWGDKRKKIVYPKEWLAGANIGFRKSVFQQYKFSPNLGRIGNSLISGEEIELCMKVQRDDGALFYTPKAVVKHVVNPSRLQKEFFKKRTFFGGVSEAIISIKMDNGYKISQKILTLLKQLLTNIFRLILTNRENKFLIELRLLSIAGQLKGFMEYLIFRKL